MLTELKIANFRGFSDEVKIRLRPITLLIGRNNSSKSSVMKLLLMLKQSCHPASLEFLAASGDAIKLPELIRQKNVLTDSDSLTFTVKFREEGSPGDVVKSYLERKCNNLDLSEIGYVLNASVRYSKDKSTRGDLMLGIEHNGDLEVLREDKITDDTRMFSIADCLPGTEASANGRKVLDYCNGRIVNAARNLSRIPPNVGGLKSEFVGDAIRPTSGVGNNGEYTLHCLQDIYQGRADAFDLVSRHLDDIVKVGDIGFERGEVLVACKATNLKTGARTNIAHLGFGVHQCLPTLVQGAIMHPHSTLMVEEPEANLHLTAQLDLANFFVDLWKQRRVCSIIETHSANMLLRLQHQIVKGELDCNDVSVAYFAIDDANKVTVKNLGINDKGTLDKGLPMEFFHKHIRETMDMATAS